MAAGGTLREWDAAPTRRKQPPTTLLTPCPHLNPPQTSACALSGALGSAAPLPALLRTGLLQHLLALLLLVLLSVCVAHAQHCTCVLSQAARRRSVQLLVVAVAGGLWALGWLRPEGAGPLGHLAVAALAARALGPPFALLLAVVSGTAATSMCCCCSTQQPGALPASFFSAAPSLTC